MSESSLASPIVGQGQSPLTIEQLVSSQPTPEELLEKALNSKDMDTFVHGVLTYATAKEGCGYHKAQLYLSSYENPEIMKFKSAIGPLSAEEFSQQCEYNLPLEQLFNPENKPNNSSLIEALHNLSVNIFKDRSPFFRAMRAGKPITSYGYKDYDAFRNTITKRIRGFEEYAIVPLQVVSKKEVKTEAEPTKIVEHTWTIALIILDYLPGIKSPPLDQNLGKLHKYSPMIAEALYNALNQNQNKPA